MRRVISTVSALAVATLLPLVATPAQAEPTTGQDRDQAHSDLARADNRPTPASTRQAALRQSAVEQLMSGEARLQGRGRARTILMADGTEVDYPASQHAKLLTFLVDFGNGEGNPDFPTQTSGPVHGEIPEPGPNDNSTYWKPSFDRQHFLDMFFNGMPEQDGQSFRDVYAEMSSGRFDLSGDVSDWVSVPHPSSYYSQADGQENGEDMADFIGDSATAWFENATESMTDQEVKDYLAGFDQWDRYDSDNDGVYHESDGYIDHFQAIHAGPGEEAGAAPWTIWSHRSGAAFDPTFNTGPDCVSANPEYSCFLPGGVEIGDTGYWIFDYTTEPENGGLGVFAHEFGHDLGLPDYYDTDNPSDNSVGFWNLMSSGSWLSDEGHATGTTPNHVGAYDKYYLGWYGPNDEDFQAVNGVADEPVTLTLGPSYHATSIGKQGVRIDLPDGHATVDGPVAASDDGAYLYSNNRSASDVTADSPPIEVPDVAEPTLTARVAYDVETDYDYVYLQVSTDGGDHWSAPIETSASTDENPNSANLGNGITGSSSGWTELTANMADYAGQTVRLRWEYLTDPATLGAFGFALDEIALGDYGTGFDVPEVDWALNGFTAVRDNTYDVTYPQAYFIENRQYAGYDSTLTSGPYSWGHNVTEEPYTVSDRFPYQDGLLVWYYNGRYGDNNTGTHPGGGVTLPVDASAAAQQWLDDESGAPLGIVDSRIQGFDATFDVDETDALALTLELDADTTGTLEVPAHPSIPVFDDSDVDAYYDDSVTGGQFLSTRVAGTGTMIQVVSSDEQTGEMVIKVGKRFVAVTSDPEIAGDASYQGVLTATEPSYFQEGVETTVAWLRDGEPIEGADETSYAVTAADIGHTISAEFTGSKEGHHDTVVATDGVEATSDPAPVPTTGPSISGTTEVGQSLTAVAAEWPVDGESTFVWSIDGSEVGTGTTYDVELSDLGEEVTLTETFSSPGYDDGTAAVESATVTEGDAPVATTPPSISGTARVGESLTATGGTWPREGTSTFTWSVDGTEVGTGTTYDVKPGDLGDKVTLTETFSSPGYEDGTAAVESATVAEGDAPVATTPPSISGTARVGRKLSVTGGTWPLAGTSTFAWSANGKEVGTGTSYVLKPADAGKKVTVTETFTSPGYAAGTSSATSGTVAKAPVGLTVTVGKAKKGKKVAVSIKASSPDLTVPGKVSVRYAGRSLGSFTLKSGVAKLSLPAKKKGSYQLVVTYPGSAGFGTASKTVTVKVK